MQHKRHRFPWAMNEINRLHNEYEIKQLTIQQIAQLHERSVYAILNKLQDEEIIDKSWKGVRGWSWSDNYNTPSRECATSVPYSRCVLRSDTLRTLSATSQPLPTLDLQPYVFFDQDRNNVDSDSDYEPSDDENDDDYEPYNKLTIFNLVRSVVTRMSQLASVAAPKKNTKVSRNQYI